VNVTEAREAYLAVREIASAAFLAKARPAIAKWEAAAAAARLAGTKLTRAEVTAYSADMNAAVAVFHGILDGPEQDLDHALAIERSNQ
jgi:hypothetical protein